MPERKVARRRAAPAALAFLAASLLLVSCHREAARPRNVIFILVDTLRADRLSGYGYARRTSPNVDAFARETVKFAADRSQASCTFPSANSILTSRWPAAFLGQPDQGLGIPEGIPSIAELLHTQGFQTVAVSASAVVRRSPSRFNPGGGFGRGFDTFEEECVWKSAACVNRVAEPYLRPRNRERDKPLFLYLHYLDPHGPYQPPKDWPRKFATGRPEKQWVRIGDPNPIGDWLYKGKPNPGFTPADLQYLKDLYDDEIAFFDERFAELLRSIRAAGLMDDSILVFVADHGEEFLEHGEIKHCRTLFDTSTHVPLLLKIPGVEPKTVTVPVQSIDLVPTLLDYLGASTGGAIFEGRSLRPEIEGKGRRDLQFGMQATLRSASDGRFKLIADLAGGAPRLFDLQADPGETKDVLAGQRRAYFGLRDALAHWLGRSEGKGAEEESVRRAREAEQKLRSLGYIE